MDLTNLYKTMVDAWAAGAKANLTIYVADEAEARVHLRVCRDAGMDVSSEAVVAPTYTGVYAYNPKTRYTTNIWMWWNTAPAVQCRRPFGLDEEVA